MCYLIFWEGKLNKAPLCSGFFFLSKIKCTHTRTDFGLYCKIKPHSKAWSPFHLLISFSKHLLSRGELDRWCMLSVWECTAVITEKTKHPLTEVSHTGEERTTGVVGWWWGGGLSLSCIIILKCSKKKQQIVLLLYTKRDYHGQN